MAKHKSLFSRFEWIAFFVFFISHQHNTDVFMMVFFSLFCHSSVCLFTACAHDIEDIVCRYQVDYNAYADVMLYYMLFAINKKWIMNVVLWSKQLGWIHIGTWTIQPFDIFITNKQSFFFFLQLILLLFCLILNILCRVKQTNLASVLGSFSVHRAPAF